MGRTSPDAEWIADHIEEVGERITDAIGALRDALCESAACPAWKDGQHCYVVTQEFTAAGPSGVVGMPTMQSAPVKVCRCGDTVRLR